MTGPTIFNHRLLSAHGSQMSSSSKSKYDEYEKKLMAFEEDTISIQGRNKHKTEYFSKFLNKTCIL